MAAALPNVVVRMADASDLGTLAMLRSQWTGTRQDPNFERRFADWVKAEGARRTSWIATVDESPAGMASLFEYRRMPRPGQPESRWGYVSNMFVREEFRDRGIGSLLLRAIIDTGDERGYARLVLSPSPRSVPLYRRAGFVIPDQDAGQDRLLVRPRP
jgi:GNAT superfamily N-acetyltransferase